MPETIYNETTVKEVIRLCTFGIPKGLGKPEEGKMCIEAIIAKAHNLPHQDQNPSCVGKEVAKCEIALTDCDWPSNEARAEGMLAIGIAQLGSNTIDQELFRKTLLLNSTRMIVPFLIQNSYNNLEVKDEILLEFKKKFETLVELDNSLWEKFYNYYYCNYSYNYNNYDYYYNYYYNNYYNNNYKYYKYYKYYYYLGLPFLKLIAETILRTLKELKSPGCDYLYLIGQ